MDPRVSQTPEAEPSPSDRDRYPTLTPGGQQLLDWMRGHPAAPIYRNRSGNRLTAAEVVQLQAEEQTLLHAPVGWPRQGVPDWLPDFVRQTYANVPHYRQQGSPPPRLQDITPISRADLARDIAPFVPDQVDVTRLINFRTTGTTGHPLLIASHPLVAARYLAYHKRALRRLGITLRHGAGQVGVVLLGYQRQCFTYLSVTPTMGESGLAKINLHPDDWRDVDDRARYLDALAPEIIAGDPLSFAELLHLPLSHRPRALLSVSMMLLPGLRDALEERFACPVLDIYSLNEVGPVAVWDADAEGHLLLQPQLYVEILNAASQPVPQGERGEITVTGGFNFCLPLLRYRTGDYAALAFGVEGPVLRQLSGRAPVRFQLPDGRWINNIDISHALKHLALPHFGLHQAQDGQVTLRLRPDSMALADAARAALAPLFGAALAIAPLPGEDKSMQYTSDLPGALDQPLSGCPAS